MSRRPESTEKLRRETGEAHRRHTDLESELEKRRGEPPRPGDLFLLERTAELPLEWAILEQAPDAPRLLAVPADGNPLVGSADVAAAVVSRSPLLRRCRFGVWLDPEALDPALRTGSLEPESLTRARHKWRALQEGTPTGSAVERDVDVETEYQDWVEDVLKKARSAFPGHPDRSGVEEPAGKRGKVLAFPTRFGWHSLKNPYALAASILLLVSLGLGREVLRSADERGSAGESRPWVNLPFFVLDAAGLRGEEMTLTVPPKAERVMLILQVDAPQLHPRYRLEVHEVQSGREVWSHGELRITGRSELSVALPVSLLPAARYRLRLSGLGDGGEEELAEYLLRIEVE